MMSEVFWFAAHMQRDEKHKRNSVSSTLNDF